MAGWLTFPRARDRVVRKLSCPPDEAAEWLREMACEGRVEEGSSRRRVRAVFTPTVQFQHPSNLQPLDQRTNHPSRGGIRFCHWIRPCDEFSGGPEVMTEYRTINHTRWYANDIEITLAGEITVAAGSSAISPRPEGEKRGPKPTWDWEPIVRDAKLAYAREGGTTQWKNLVTLLLNLAEKQTGRRPSSDSTAESYATEIRRNCEVFLVQPGN